jgi:hypothetical protein
MVDSATYAVDVGGGAARWTKLEDDLKALESVASSKRWPDTSAAARLPQVKIVQADCAPIGAG